MKYLLIAIALLSLAGCTNTPSAHYFSSSDAIGKTLKDKDGCTFVVIYNSSYSRIELQPMVDDSLPTCKLFTVEPSAATTNPAPAQSVN